MKRLITIAAVLIIGLVATGCYTAYSVGVHARYGRPYYVPRPYYYYNYWYDYLYPYYGGYYYPTYVPRYHHHYYHNYNSYPRHRGNYYYDGGRHYDGKKSPRRR